MNIDLPLSCIEVPLGYEWKAYRQTVLFISEQPPQNIGTWIANEMGFDRDDDCANSHLHYLKLNAVDQAIIEIYVIDSLDRVAFENFMSWAGTRELEQRLADLSYRSIGLILFDKSLAEQQQDLQVKTAKREEEVGRKKLYESQIVPKANLALNAGKSKVYLDLMTPYLDLMDTFQRKRFELVRKRNLGA